MSECLGPKFFGLKINNGQGIAEIYIKNAIGNHEYKATLLRHDFTLTLWGESSLGSGFRLKLHIKSDDKAVVLEQDVELVTLSNTITLKKLI